MQWAPNERLQTVGQKRPGYATVGFKTEIEVNAFAVGIESLTVHQYDVVLKPTTTSREFNGRILRKVQDDNPNIFTSKASYDGRAIMVSPKKLQFQNGEPSGSISVAMPPSNPTKPPDPFEVKLTLVGQVNLESLEDFVYGGATSSNESLTGVTALNIALRMDPSFKYPLRGKSFFIKQLGSRLIGAGIELRSGLFQSLRPGNDGAFLNVDVTTAMMYRTGNLLELCMDVLEVPFNTGATFFTPGHGNWKDGNRALVERFITGVKVFVPTTGTKKRTVRGLTQRAANKIQFDLNGVQTTVSAYFQKLGHATSTPQVICAEIGDRALVPLQLCTVAPDQVIRKQIPSHKTNDFVDFARKTPEERFRVIREGIKLLGHTQSEYVKAFGLKVDEASLLKIAARRLPPPKLLHGRQSKAPHAAPVNGSWNMADKHVYISCPPLKNWIMIVFDNRFTDTNCNEVVQGMMSEARKLGMRMEAPPAQRRANSGGNVIEQIRQIVIDYNKTTKANPQMLFVVMPDAGSDQLRIQVKWFGTFTPTGIATQCVKSFKCRGARAQYWANVLIQMNAKLGGINSIPDPALNASLADVQKPTIVMGADVAHPSPGPEGPPSFAALVWSIDQNHMKYNCRDSVQTGRQEIIVDFKSMVEYALKNYYAIRKVWPKRVIFFRDGVSEGQFQAVKEQELKMLKDVLRELKLEYPAVKITYCVVGKRHHIRFNALNDKDKDRKSGNVLAGTVVDTGITHPVENDFYLASHGGIIGTSRPAHYSIIDDENNFSPNEQEEISYSLCHGYASCTRSVSIPIPVYYADKACEYARYRFPPSRPMAPAHGGSESGQDFFAKLKAEFDSRPLSRYAESNMYFA